jgi:hypothetical protein
MQPLAKAEEKHLASALQHNGKMEGVTDHRCGRRRN